MYAKGEKYRTHAKILCDLEYHPTSTAGDAHQRSISPDHLNDIPPVVVDSPNSTILNRCMSLINTRCCTTNSDLLVAIGTGGGLAGDGVDDAVIRY